MSRRSLNFQAKGPYLMGEIRLFFGALAQGSGMMSVIGMLLCTYAWLTKRRPVVHDLESQREPLLLHADESNTSDERASASSPSAVVNAFEHTDQNQGQRELPRNVEDNIERPMRGSNYNDETPWHQHDNPFKRHSAIIGRQLWHLVVEAALRSPEGVRRVTAPVLMAIGALLFLIGWIPLSMAYFIHYLFEGVMRVLCVPVMFPLPFWVVAFIVTNVFFYLAIVDGRFPLVPMMAEGFLVTWAAILGKCIRRGYPVFETGGHA